MKFQEYQKFQDNWAPLTTLVYLVIFFRLPELASAVSPTLASLSLPVLCKIDRSGFLRLSSEVTADGDVAMTAGLAAAAATAGCGESLDSCPLTAGLPDASDLRKDRCSTSFRSESSFLLLSPSMDFLPYNIKQQHANDTQNQYA